VSGEDPEPLARLQKENDRLAWKLAQFQVLLAAIRRSDEYDPDAMVQLYDQELDRANKAEAERDAARRELVEYRQQVTKRMSKISKIIKSVR